VNDYQDEQEKDYEELKSEGEEFEEKLIFVLDLIDYLMDWKMLPKN
jgi:hypothetical protein